MTLHQARVLDELTAHPWQKCHELWKTLHDEIARSAVDDLLKRLERKGLVRRASGPRRVSCWAPADVPVPAGMMLLASGFPSLYHAANLPQRVVEVLTGRPWLTLRMISTAIGSAGKPKAIEQAARQLLAEGRIQRRLVDTPIRRFYVYALPGKYLVSRQREQLVKDVIGVYGYGEGFAKTMAVLSKRGPDRKLRWMTAREISEEAGIRKGYIFNVLGTQLNRGIFRRLRILEPGVASGRGVVFKYALKEAEPPDQPIAEEPTAGDDALAKMATVIQENPGISSITAREKYGARYRPTSFDYACNVLRKLESLGVISNVRKWDGRKSWRKAWQANGQAAELMASRARVHVDLIEKSAKKLRSLGFTVKVHVSRNVTSEPNMSTTNRPALPQGGTFSEEASE